MTKRLELRFENELGNIVTIALDNPLDNLTEETVSAAMDAVIAGNGFISNGGNLVAKRDARIVSRSVDTILAS
ncbi:DUF2922 domain-containing protein [Bacillus sp. FJAT-44742]|uniref:DUF2922 domain-containing protein n=1 Tax=Bacillus sp. FJAT-44742 TaxID=2014005 RepID=UPI000C250F86|nr:DUF2922 domain-containing protein [Bacillus sp. FJAT-44742]